MTTRSKRDVKISACGRWMRKQSKRHPITSSDSISSKLVDDPPRVQCECQKCGQPAEHLFAAGPGLICATCKSQQKGNQ